MFETAEAHGRAVWQLDVDLPPAYRIDSTSRTVRRFYASGDLILPAEEAELDVFALTWGREYARESGVTEWAS